MLPAPIALLIAALLIAPVGAPEPEISTPLRIRTERVELEAVQQGLELRVGEAWRRWSIDVAESTEPSHVEVQLRDDAGHIHTRALPLKGETIEERSRALASSLALLVEQLDPGEPATAEPTPGKRSTDVAGFVGAGPRMALNVGGPLDLDAGASVVGGAWLLRDHLQPIAELAWAHSAAAELKLDALRFGAGLLGGASAAQGRVWGGGGAVLRAQWAHASASGTAAGWWASPAVMGAIQYRGRLLVLGLWVGADLLLPPLRARGDAHTLHWSAVRPMATLHIGLRLPWGPRHART